MDEADYCDRLALIYRGKIIAEGTPDELRKDFMKRDVLEIEAERLVDALDILSKHDMESAIFGSVLHVTVENAASEEPVIRKLLSDAGITVRKVEKIVPSLEDVFVTLIETS
jgi:ABC-2 type transport system ATP-binding protein